MVTFVALLDPPSTRSYGVVPFIVEGGALAEPTVIGLAGGPRPLGLDPGYSLDQFVAAGHARRIPFQHVTFPDVPSGMLAGWLGTGFSVECLQRRLPRPTTGSVSYQGPEGIFWFEPAADCYGRLEIWTAQTAPRAIRDRSPGIAKLMSWCLPTHILTMAAEWHAAPAGTKEEAGRLLHQLAYPIRKGRRAMTYKAFEKRLADTVKRLGGTV